MWISTKEVAARLGIAPMTVRRLIYSGQLKASKVGRLIRVKDTELEAFMASTEEKRRE